MKPSKPDTDIKHDLSDNDFWEQVAKKYGTEVAERLKAFGVDGRRLIEQYGGKLPGTVKIWAIEGLIRR